MVYHSITVFERKPFSFIQAAFSASNANCWSPASPNPDNPSSTR